MTRYKVTGRVAVIPSGIIALSASQSGTRLGNLSPAGDGLWDVRRPIEFKAGEEFGYAGDLPKAIAEAVEEIETPRSGKPESRSSRRQENTPATE